MVEQKIITDRKLIAKYKAEWDLVEKLDGGWEMLFKDPKSGEDWRYVRLNNDYHNSEFAIVFAQPEPSIEDLIVLIIESKDLEFVAVCAAYLRDNLDEEDQDHRQTLITRCEEHLGMQGRLIPRKERKKLKIIIENSRLDDDHNQRPTMNKPFEVVDADHTYYKDIAKRAKAILKRVKGGWGF